MSLLGFNAIGRFALGQISGSLAPTVNKAHGVGVAGTIQAVQGAFVVVIGVAGIGTAGTISDAITRTFTGAAGIGRAGTIDYGGPGRFVGVPRAPSIGVAGIIVAGISGGGVSTRLIEDRPRDKRRKTGFEPVAKRYDPPVPIEPAKPPLPPFRDAPAAPLTAPDDLLELVPPGLLSLQDQIFNAQDSFDIEQFLGGIDHDEHDAADIADVLALLDD